MIKVRKAQDRGHTQLGWLDSWHTFSFGDYYDPSNMGFRDLRVINEDYVAPATGFGMHPHRDMEIITYVLEGSLQHEDSMGNGSIIRPGDIQRMSAGTGVTHSEQNPSPEEPVHLLQIWILPARQGIPPNYEQRSFDRSRWRGGLMRVAGPAGERGDGPSDEAVAIHQDASLYAGLLDKGETITHALAPGRHGWLQIARGAVSVNGEPLHAGDGAAIIEEEHLTLAGEGDAEILLFDLP